MTAPDAPQVEPLTLTLEEAMRDFEGAGLILRSVGTLTQHGTAPWWQAGRFVPYAGFELRAEAAMWTDVHQAVFGRPVVERDDTAELVEALEQAYRLLSDNYDSPLDFVEGITSAKHILDAALARVKGGER